MSNLFWIFVSAAIVTNFVLVYFLGLCPVIGVVEVVGGILLLVRRVAWVGAVMLALLMVGAVTTTLRHEGAGAALMPALLLTSLTSLTYYRFPRKQLPAAPEAH